MRRKRLAAFGFWLLFALAAAVVAVLRGNWAAWCVLVVLVALPLGSFGLNFQVRRKLRARLTLPPTAEKGQAVTGTLLLENSSRLPTGMVLLELCLENRLTGETTAFPLSVAAPAQGEEAAEVRVESPHCGNLRLQIGRAVVTDWFGFLALRVPLSAAADCVVLPESFAVETRVRLPLCTPREEESYAPDRSGHDLTEVFALRDYAPGDSRRQIHWKLSGKLGRTVVREGSRPVARTFLVFWDKNTAPASAAELDAMGECVASLCQAFSEAGAAYSLGWTEGGHYRTEEIETLEQLLQTIPRLLKAGAAPEQPVQPPLAQYGKCLVIGKGTDYALEHVTAIAFGAAADGDGVLAVTPENCRQRLRGLEF